MATRSTAGLAERIEAAYDPASPADIEAVEETIRLLDRGEVRSAERQGSAWVGCDWVRKAILLYFRLRGMESIELGPFEYRDKIPLKRDYEQAGVRVVPPGTVRYGAFLGRDVVVMPAYVNIGAWVGPGTMIDTWATVGSCAQVGAGVHVAGGAGIGGVLEPVQARPVVVEDHAFIGSRCILTEGVVVGEGAILGANAVLTASTPVIDVTRPEPREYRGQVPARAIVVPGTRPKRFPAGEFQLACSLIIGWREERTEPKVSLNQALREHGVPT